ncbi:MAG: hypothetical protein GWP18_00960 [Proteobacteria bacterium]|nr:hypothetical protein [Pseudomonadota bacterium]
MRNGLVRVIFLVVLALVVAAAPAAAVTVHAEDLLENGAMYDGQEIVIVGELIGDYGFRRDGWMWTQLNDDSYARAPVVEGGVLTGANTGIAVRMPTAMGRPLDAPGRYRTVGPVVEATGVWKYHDASRAGETFLEITSIRVVEPGRRLSEHPNAAAYGAGVVLLLVSVFMSRQYIRKRDGET